MLSSQDSSQGFHLTILLSVNLLKHIKLILFNLFLVLATIAAVHNVFVRYDHIVKFFSKHVSNLPYQKPNRHMKIKKP